MKSTANFLEACPAELASLSRTTTAALRLEVDGDRPRMWLAADLCEVLVDDRLDATGEPGEVGL